MPEDDTPKDDAITQRQSILAAESIGATNTDHTEGPQQVKWMVIGADREI
jgi:hypothetical protein